MGALSLPLVTRRLRVCVCVRVRVRACACASARVICVRASVRAFAQGAVLQGKCVRACVRARACVRMCVRAARYVCMPGCVHSCRVQWCKASVCVRVCVCVFVVRACLPGAFA